MSRATHEICEFIPLPSTCVPPSKELLLQNIANLYICRFTIQDVEYSFVVKRIAVQYSDIQCQYKVLYIGNVLVEGAGEALQQ